MQLGSTEHDELMAQFEKDVATKFSVRLDKEDKSLWRKGIVYQDGRTNDLFLLYRFGVSYGQYTCR